MASPSRRGRNGRPAGRPSVLESKEIALHVLFVCTGNICRSPTAERLAAGYGDQFQHTNWTASSAGTHAVISHPIHREAALVLEELGGDPHDFAARQLTPRIAAGADLILTMTRAHRDDVLSLAPQRLNRTFTLSEAARLASEFDAHDVVDLAALRSHVVADDSLDIADPIGMSADVFRTIGRRIAELLPPVVQLCRNSQAC